MLNVLCQSSKWNIYCRKNIWPLWFNKYCRSTRYWKTSNWRAGARRPKTLKLKAYTGKTSLAIKTRTSWDSATAYRKTNSDISDRECNGGLTRLNYGMRSRWKSVLNEWMNAFISDTRSIDNENKTDTEKVYRQTVKHFQLCYTMN